MSASTTAPAAASLYNNIYYTATGGSNAYAPNTNVTTDSVPDLLAKVAADPGWGHYEIFGLTRWFRSRATLTGQGANQEANRVTHGYGVGASVLLPLVPKTLDFEARYLTGTGIGRYGSAGEPDATLNPNDGSIAPLHGYHAMGAFILRPAPAWTLLVYAGVEHVGARAYDTSSGSGVPVTYGYGYGNPLFSNAGCEIEGSSTCAANTSSIKSAMAGGWWKFYQGGLGNMQLGLTDTYLRRDIFAGVGGDPNTNINIAMISFRYYPYQR